MLRLQVQMVETHAPLEDQARPGHRPVADVRPDEGGEGPPLQVGSPKSLVEEDPMTGVSQPVAQLDVLDGPRGASRVEAGHRLEHGAADGAAAGPEGRRLRIALLMHEVMKKVPELGDDAGSARRRVVRTEYGGDVRLFLQDPGDPPDRARRDHHVRVDEQQHVARRVPRAVVASGAGAGVSVEAKEPHRQTGCNGRETPGIYALAVDDSLPSRSS